MSTASPSYSRYAKARSIALNPGLWDGLELCVHSPLGKTGPRAENIANRRRFGTLTTMDLATDCVVTSKGCTWDFDGIDGYIDFGDLDHWTESVVDGFTIAGWLKRPDITATDNWVNKYQAGHTEFIAGFLATRFYGWVRDNTGGRHIGRYAANLGTYCSNDAWHHFAMTYNGGTTSASVKLYIDGVRRDSTNFTTGAGSFTTIRNTDAPLTLGKDSAGLAGAPLEGQSTGFSLHSRPLALSEIQLLHSDEHAIVRPKIRVWPGITEATDSNTGHWFRQPRNKPHFIPVENKPNFRMQDNKPNFTVM